MNTKRILSLILTISIIMTSFVSAVFAAEEEQSADAPYEQAVAVLGALGIMEGKSETDFAPDDYLTRAEMSTIAVRFLGINSEKTGDAESGFTDVDETHWGRPFINTATALDIIHGNGDGTFEPDGETTAEQAIKILVCALGYEPKVATRGEYPAGHLSVAAELGLLKGIDFSDGTNTPIPRWKVAMLVFNALEVDLMDVVVYGETDYSIVTEEKTALGVYHEVEKKYGTVTATYEGSLGGDYADLGEITIDGIEYTTKLNAAKYLGYYVDYYCTITKGSEKSEVLAIFPIEDKAERIEVDFDDVVSINVGTGFDVEAEYYDKGGEKKKRVSLVNPVIIYNGKAESFETGADATAFLDRYMNQGQLVFLQNSKLGARDVLFVESYEAYVISEVNPEHRWISYNIYTAEGIERGVLDLSSVDEPNRRVFYYDENGNEIGMGDIGIDDVLMVYESSDKLVYNIYRSRKRVSGKVERTEKIEGESGISGEIQKKYETISVVNFKDIEVPHRPTHNSSWSLKGTGTTDKGHDYVIDYMAYSGQISTKSDFYTLDDIGADDFGGLKGKSLPEISSGTLLRMSREPQPYDWDANLLNPHREAMTRARNIFDKSEVKVGDVLKITAWVYTDDIANGDTSKADGVYPVEDQENATSAFNMYLSEERATDKFNNGHNHAGYANKDEGVSLTDLKNHEWTELSFEYEVTTTNKKAASLRIDASKNSSTPYARNTFIAGFKVERLTEGRTIEDEYVFPTDKTRYKFFIDGVGYEPVKSLYSSLISRDEEVTLLLDLKGRIAGYVTGKQKSAYGLLMDVAVQNGAFGEDSLLVKIMETDGTTTTYETMDEIKAWNGAEVVKMPVANLVTDQPIDVQKDWHLWSTDNSSQFDGVGHTWLEADNKSDAASRKIVYYETNPQGKISKIIVPSVPEEHPEAKVVMVWKFRFHAPQWHNVFQSVGTRTLSFVNAIEKDELMYQISNDAVVYEAIAMNYDEADYSLIQGGVTSLSYANIYEGMGWNNAQLYRYPGSDVIDFMIINSRQPDHGSTQTKVVIVDSIGESVDGYTLEGYSDGLPYSKNIRPNTRVQENNLVTDPGPDGVVVTREMLPELAEQGVKPYCVTYETEVMGNQKTPFVSPESVHKGDIVRICERGDEIVFLEICRRKSLGIVTCFNTTDPTRYASMDWNACLRGEVTRIDREFNHVFVTDYYFTGPQWIHSWTNSSPSGIPFTKAEYRLCVGEVAMSVYELDTGKCYVGTPADIELGDEIFSWKYPSSPNDLIILKNGNK